MAEIQPTITFLTGPNRGLGRALLEALLQRPNNVVIAGVRDPQAPISQSLSQLPRAEGSELHVVKYDAAVDTDAASAVKSLSEKNITYIDRVISNAGFSDTVVPILETKPNDIRRHMDVHLYGPLTLFQATEPLLKASKDPKFFTMSSGLASLGAMEYVPGPWYCYGVTKITQSFTIRKMHFEHEWLTSVVLNPGWMKTEMGAWAAKALNMGEDGAPVEVKDSVKGCLQVINDASREKYSGQFVSYEQEIVPW